MTRRVSVNSGQESVQPTPTVHRGNMDDWYEPSPPYEGGQVSSHDKKQIQNPVY